MERFQYNKYNTSNNTYNSYDNSPSKNKYNKYNKYNKSKYVIQSRQDDETTDRYTANNSTNMNAHTNNSTNMNAHTNNITNTNKIIKTTISCCESICDENGQVIPNGNYYFTIKEYNDTYCKGSLSSNHESLIQKDELSFTSLFEDQVDLKLLIETSFVFFSHFT